ncbi:hypothetical protein RGF97_32430 [Streptomyces roseicoloratus]|uniref:Uncharacterized protein n=1 Tax=Streptomyces roseicoloratus TaxID=2508722 RepID=A0ABY9S2A3_9ACTN|nr:hypothetical protein [Streptomyces roseicoloratus]WMX48566.1 hypothetical protein RGF97_32430 [Streptomyces roseicoloratus]
MGAVVLVGRRGTVLGFLVEEFAQGARALLADRRPLLQRRVDLREPAPVEDLTVTVQDDVVVTEVEEEVVRGQPEQGVGEQRVFREVDRRGQVRPDPLLGGAERIGLRAEVLRVQRGVGIGRNLPGRALFISNELHA